MAQNGSRAAKVAEYKRLHELVYSLPQSQNRWTMEQWNAFRAYVEISSHDNHCCCPECIDKVKLKLTWEIYDCREICVAANMDSANLMKQITDIVKESFSLREAAAKINMIHGLATYLGGTHVAVHPTDALGNFIHGVENRIAIITVVD